MGQPQPLFCIFDSKAFYKQWQCTLTIDWTFPHRSVVFISGFFSQWEGVLGRYAPLRVTVHLRMPLMQTTVDSMSIFEASKFEWVAMLRSKSRTEYRMKCQFAMEQFGCLKWKVGCKNYFWHNLRDDKFEIWNSFFTRCEKHAAAWDRTRVLQISEKW